MLLEDVTVEVRDRNGGRVGTIPPDDLDVELAPVVNGVGAWTLTLPASHHMAPVLRTPGAGIIATDFDGTVILSGPVETPKVQRTSAAPASMVTFSGVCDNHVLWDRLAFPDPRTADTMAQGSDYDTRSGSAEAVIHGYVGANAGPSAPEARRVPGLTMAPPGNAGGAVQKSARFDVLGELVSGIAETGGVVFSVQQWDQQRRFATRVRRDLTALIRLDVDNGSLSGHTVAVSVPKVTHVVAGSQEVELDRIFTTVASQESLEASASWGRRIEQFMDQRQALDEGESTQGARELLATDGITQVVAQAVVSENLTMRFGRDWGLGDIVTVVTDGQELRATVTGAVIKINKSGVRIGVVLGDATGFNPEAATRRQIERTSARVSNLERNETAAGASTTAPSVTANFAAAQRIWSVTHGFNKRPVQVDCIDGDGAVLFGDVVYPSTNGTNVVEIHWAIPMSGTAVVRK